MDPTRRSFLIKTSAGAAGAAAVLGGGLAFSSATSDDPGLSAEEAAELEDQPVLVEIRDAQHGEVNVLVGEREVAFTNKALVAQVLRAAR